VIVRSGFVGANDRDSPNVVDVGGGHHITMRKPLFNAVSRALHVQYTTINL